MNNLDDKKLMAKGKALDAITDGMGVKRKIYFRLLNESDKSFRERLKTIMTFAILIEKNKKVKDGK